MTDEQRRIHDEIASGPRGRVEGPLKVWLHSPELANHAQKLGAYARFHSRLEPRLAEIAICVTGAHFKADFEWWAHSRFAHDAGIPEVVTEAIRNGETPVLDAPDQQVVYDAAIELNRDHGLSDATHARAVEILGLPALVDLIAIVGYYHMVSLTLNVFQIPTPDGSRPFD